MRSAGVSLSVYIGCYPNIRISMDSAYTDVATPSRSYAVTLADDAIDQLTRLLAEVKAPERRFVVSSPLVWRMHGARFANAVKHVEPILVPDGERYKQLPTVVRIYDALVRAN